MTFVMPNPRRSSLPGRYTRPCVENPAKGRRKKPLTGGEYAAIFGERRTAPVPFGWPVVCGLRTALAIELSSVRALMENLRAGRIVWGDEWMRGTAEQYEEGRPMG